MHGIFHKAGLTAAALAAVSVSAAPIEATDFAARCAGLTTESLNIPDATVWFSSYVAANTNITFPDNHPTCTPTSQVTAKDICRVTLYVATGPGSGVSMEAWLPRNWTGRFLATGNGGMAGCIKYQDVQYGTSLGFATVGHNNGHNGTSGAPLFDNLGVTLDFTERSVHVATVAGKLITEKFYGQPQNKSYYLGCSTGGRQGFKSAQSWPDDFDGIVAGAPAFDFNSLQFASGQPWVIMGGPGSPTYLNTTQFALVSKDIMTQCDLIDGVADGIIEDPSLCHYDPSGLRCRCGQDKSTCLTKTQVETVRKLFSTWTDDDGTVIYPRTPPGGEAVESIRRLWTGTPFQYTSDWWKYVIYNNSAWDPATLTPADWRAAQAVDSKIGSPSTWQGDLSAFRDRGGRILTYHGEADGLISALNSPRYYEHVRDTMALSTDELDEFYRFFRISGMGHCRQGPGAAAFGQDTGMNAGLEPDRNVLTAMVRWVEEGEAPDSFLGVNVDWTKLSATGALIGDDGKLLSPVKFSRRHCRYPLRNTYKGGDPNVPESWECKATE